MSARVSSTPWPALVGAVVACAACGGGAGASGGNGGGGGPDAGTASPDGSSIADASSPDASTPDGAASDAAATSGVDADQDGLDDGLEAAWANAYMPYLSIDPADKCPTHGLLVRVSPDPLESTRVMIWYDVLYDADCGANGHVGDDEVFGVVIDPKTAPPAGILAVRGISHQNTPCQQVTTCGRCTGLTACGTAKRNGADTPAVYPSVDKHGNYAVLATCNASILCDFGGCALSPAPDAPPIVNAGEPGHPLVTDLTTQGFVTTANGWTNTALFHFDPWTPGNFGGAGDVSKDLVDTSFVTDTTGCP